MTKRFPLRRRMCFPRPHLPTRFFSAALLLVGCASAAVLAGCVAGAARQTAGSTPARAVVRPATAPPLRCTVEVYGDSIIASNGTQERPLAALRRARPRLTFIEHSAPEWLLTDLAHRFDELPRSGRWVVIENGVIDAWRNVKPALYVQTLQRIIERVRAEGREPILTGFSRQVATPALHIRKAQLIRRDQYDELTRITAAQMKVAFVDWGSVRFDGRDDLQDGIHPNLDYSNRLFEKLLSTLDRVTQCR